MKKLFFLFGTVLLSGKIWSFDKYSITPYKPFINTQTQTYLYNSINTKRFLDKYGKWWFLYDEISKIPISGFGNPIKINTLSSESILKSFFEIFSEFHDGEITCELKTRNTLKNGLQSFIFTQKYKGIDVLFSYLKIVINKNGEMVRFSSRIFPNINIPIDFKISIDKAKYISISGIPGKNFSFEEEGLVVFPYPLQRQYEYKLAWTFIVKGWDLEENMPFKLFTVVDANTGKILYRSNMVKRAININVVGTIYPDGPCFSTQQKGMPYQRIVIGGTTYYTNDQGNISIGNISPPVNATFYLDGKYAKVIKYGQASSPSFSQSLTQTSNTVSWDPQTSAPIQMRTAYWAVNIVHSKLKAAFPSYTGLDFPMVTYVDDNTGTCNAYYDGNLNFYAAGGGCNATANLPDVVYHEYGHGINEHFYSDAGLIFSNSALHEGYADIWALSITDTAVLGLGFYSNNCSGYIRRYDIIKKKYPDDISGEPHNDGEIIAGAWWDLRMLTSDTLMFSLFAQHYYLYPNAPDGQEGQLFQDILIDVLTVDDDNGNLNDGTPNSSQISCAFAMHGITLLANTDPNNITSEVLTPQPAWQPITINANVQSTYPWYISSLTLNYKINNSTNWNTIPMTNAGGNNYTATIPPQPAGTVIAYYVSLEAGCPSDPIIVPFKANSPYPYTNLPYFIITGVQMKNLIEFENTFGGSWTQGIATDDAQTGIWTIDQPIPSYIGSTIVQPDTDHTPTTFNFCALTGNSTDTSSPGSNDVDNGTTTLLSPVFDLSSYSFPIIEYWRYFTNDQGANPGNDPFRVFISDNGTSWTPVEFTYTAHHKWRRNVFRVKDYVNNLSSIQLKFVVSDSVLAGQNLNGQSLVEALLDDITFYDTTMVVGITNNLQEKDLLIYYNLETKNLLIENISTTHLFTSIYNTEGKLLKKHVSTGPSGNVQIPLNDLPSGNYSVCVKTQESAIKCKNIVIP